MERSITQRAKFDFKQYQHSPPCYKDGAGVVKIYPSQPPLETRGGVKGKQGGERSCYFCSQKGFTLLEIMVALSIFTVALLLTTDIFQRIIEGQRNAIASINVQENFRYALEIMGKEIRNAETPLGGCYSSEFGDNSDDNNTYSAIDADNSVAGIHGNGLGVRLVFRNKYGECITYYENSGRLYIRRNNMIYPITPNNIRVNRLAFNVSDDGNDPNINTKPSVTLQINAEVIGKESESNELNIQTTITSRQY